MPRQREEVLNARLGQLLIARHPLWNENNVHIDSTHTIRDHAGWKIDILIENPGGQPVAIETKFASGAVGTLRNQIEDRLGNIIDESGEPIEAGISIKIPTGLSSSNLENAKLECAVHQLMSDGSASRWPIDDEDWLIRTVDELTDVVEVVSLSEKRIAESGKIFEEGVKDASSHLQRNETKLGAVLHQEEGEQTTRMAVSILANAFIFHYAIEGEPDIPDVAKGRAANGFLKSRVMRVWDTVLDINYWPIFSIAQDILDKIPTRAANPMLDRLDEVAQQLLKVGATTFHDLSGRMFQTLIMDRKFLATFYTLPASACLLAELAVSRLNIDWGKDAEVKGLKIADFACGTGALLSATQRAIFRRYRRAGGNDADLHRDYMENVLLGVDIMPSAVHLTASMLSSTHPGVGYDESLIRVLPYGKDVELSKHRHTDPNIPYIGALDLLGDEFGYSIFTETGTAHRLDIGGKQITGKKGLNSDQDKDFPVEHNSFDLVIMNPPFTRPTGHEASKVGVPIPSFAGFDMSEDEQRAMSRKLKAQEKTYGHGNAGLASDFMDLAHIKLKTGGILALILPFAFVSGRAWSNARNALMRDYQDIHIISIAAEGNTNRSFSADTGMAECLIIATKAKQELAIDVSSSDSIQYSNLNQRSKTLLEAHELARNIGRGATVKGTFLDSGAAGIRDDDIGLVMVALRKGKLELPRETRSHSLPLTAMENVASRGLYHMDISGTAPRGAFDIKVWNGRGEPTYPALWSHHAGRKDGERERRFIVQPDSEGIDRKIVDQKAKKTWQTTASRLHHNVDFRLNSQSLALCITLEKSMGGRAWPNIIPHKERYEMPLLLWSNTTLGLMLFWWCATRQQSGRASLKITAIPNLPTLDARKLSKEQFASCEQIFDDFKDRYFLPANEAYKDQMRKDLDAAIFSMLKLPEGLLNSLGLLRLKWCSEPSVHGGKNTRPRESSETSV